MKLSIFLVSFLLGLVLSCAENSNIADQISLQGKTWCVVTVSAANEKLQAYLKSACSELDCKEVAPGGSCYEPNTLQNHASYVLNLDYRAHGTCNSQIGTPSLNDPSFGKCHYT